MFIHTIDFVVSSPGLKGMPVFDLPEFAFIGRSNVGKSSLINMLCARKSIAKVSGTPGKTRLINHFKVTSIPSGYKIQDAASGIQHRERSDNWYLVDLPGYGWARLNKEQREKFEKMIRTYLSKRENLACTFLLIDSRHPLQKIDLDFMNWLGDEKISFVILFTKTDKLSKVQLSANLTAYRDQLSVHWQELPTIIPISSITKQGREEILDSIQSMLNEIL